MASFRNASIALKRKQTHPFDVQRSHDINFRSGFSTAVAVNNGYEINHKFNFPFRGTDVGPLYLQLSEYSLDASVSLTGASIMQSGKIFEAFPVEWMLGLQTSAPAGAGTLVNIFRFYADIKSVADILSLPYVIVNSVNTMLTSAGASSGITFDPVVGVFAIFTNVSSKQIFQSSSNSLAYKYSTVSSGGSETSSVFNYADLGTARNPAFTVARPEIVFVSFGPELGPEFTRILETKSLDLLNEQTSQLLYEYSSVSGATFDGQNMSNYKTLLPTDMCMTNFYLDFAMAARNMNPALCILLFGTSNPASKCYLTNYEILSYQQSMGNKFGVLPLASNYGAYTVQPDKRSLKNNLFQKERDTTYGCVPPVWSNPATGLYILDKNKPNPAILYPRGKVRGAPFLFDLVQDVGISEDFYNYFLNLGVIANLSKEWPLYSAISPFATFIDMNKWSNIYNNEPMGYCSSFISSQIISDITDAIESSNVLFVNSLMPDSSGFTSQYLPTSPPCLLFPIRFVNCFNNLYPFEMTTQNGCFNNSLSFPVTSPSVYGPMNNGMFDPYTFSQMPCIQSYYSLLISSTNFSTPTSPAGINFGWNYPTADVFYRGLGSVPTLGTAFSNTSLNLGFPSTVVAYDKDLYLSNGALSRFPLFFNSFNTSLFSDNNNPGFPSDIQKNSLALVGQFAENYVENELQYSCSSTIPRFYINHFLSTFQTAIYSSNALNVTTPTSLSATYSINYPANNLFLGGNNSVDVSSVFNIIPNSFPGNICPAPNVSYPGGPISTVVLASDPLQNLSYNTSATVIPWNTSSFQLTQNFMSNKLFILDSNFTNLWSFANKKPQSGTFEVSGNSVLLSTCASVAISNNYMNSPSSTPVNFFGALLIDVSESPLILPASSVPNPSVYPNPPLSNSYTAKGLHFFANGTLNPLNNGYVLSDSSVIPASQSTFPSLPWNRLDASYDFDCGCFGDYSGANNVVDQLNILISFKGPFINNINVGAYSETELNYKNYSFIPKRDVGCMPVTLSVGYNTGGVPPLNLFGALHSLTNDLPIQYPANLGVTPFFLVGGFNQSVTSGLSTMYHLNPTANAIAPAMSSLNVMSVLPEVTDVEANINNPVTAPMLVAANFPNFLATQALYATNTIQGTPAGNGYYQNMNIFKLKVPFSNALLLPQNLNTAAVYFNSGYTPFSWQNTFKSSLMATNWLSFNSFYSNKISALQNTILLPVSPVCFQIPSDSGTGYKILSTTTISSTIQFTADTVVAPFTATDLTTQWLNYNFNQRILLPSDINYNSQYYPLVSSYSYGDMSSGYQGLVFAFVILNQFVKSNLITFYDLKCSFAQRDVDETRVGGKRYESGDPQHY